MSVPKSQMTQRGIPCQKTRSFIREISNSCTTASTRLPCENLSWICVLESCGFWRIQLSLPGQTGVHFYSFWRMCDSPKRGIPITVPAGAETSRIETPVARMTVEVEAVRGRSDSAQEHIAGHRTDVSELRKVSLAAPTR
jgi:hypothetical protein